MTSCRKFTVNNHHFPRKIRCITGINQFVKENKNSTMEAAVTLEATFTKGKFSVYNFLQKMKSTGLITTKASRGKSKNESN